MFRGSRWVSVLLLLAFAACSTPPPPPPPPVAAAPAPAPLAPADAAFATAAAQSDQYVIKISQIAAEKVGRPAVRDFAQTVVDTHTQSLSRLSSIVTPRGLTLPD